MSSVMINFHNDAMAVAKAFVGQNKILQKCTNCFNICITTVTVQKGETAVLPFLQCYIPKLTPGLQMPSGKLQK